MAGRGFGIEDKDIRSARRTFATHPEDSRAIAVKRQEEEALTAERRQSAEREARAQSERVTAQSETDRVTRDAEAARIKAQAEAERLTRERMRRQRPLWLKLIV